MGPQFLPLSWNCQYFKYMYLSTPHFIKPSHSKQPRCWPMQVRLQKQNGRDIQKFAANWQTPPLAAEWDSLGQLRDKLTTSIFIFPLFFLLLLLFVWLHLKIVNRCIKNGKSSCHIVCFPNVTFPCSAVTFHFFQIPKNSNSCAGCACACSHIQTEWHEDACA